MSSSKTTDPYLVENLTSREREILVQLADRRTDREIADTLMLSLNTVKWYTRQIYAKLGVNGRRMAVRRAQQLGLLGQTAPASTLQSGFPVSLTPFVGREEDIQRICHLLMERAYRLVTLVGPGGIGKTRLAIQTVHTLAKQKPGSFADGVFFVALAGLDEWQTIVHAVAHAVGLSFQASREPPVQQLFDHVGSRQMLIVLDNFEHLIGPESNTLLLDLLTRSPNLQVIVTSRSQLNLYGERVYPLGGLDMPDCAGGDQVAPLLPIAQTYGALQLFDQHARQFRPDFRLDETNLEAAMRICQAVGGMPLAIELATSWVKVLSVEEIAAEVEHGLGLFETDAHGVPERHRSLRAVCDASWALLTVPEQAALQQLAVFHGGFDRAAAEVVADIRSNTLLALVNKSWLRRGRDNRFEIHELLRQYCAERLAQNPSAEAAAQDRHSAYYCNWLNRQEAALKGSRQYAALDAVTVELANVLEACHWAASHAHAEWLAQAANPLGLFFKLTGDLQNGIQALTRLINALPEVDAQEQNTPATVYHYLARGRLLTQISALSGELIDPSTSHASIESIEKTRSLLTSPILSAVDTRQERAQLALAQGYNYYASLPDLAIQCFAESFALCQVLGDREGMAAAQLGLGRSYRTAGSTEQAREALLASLALYEEIGNVVGQSSALAALCSVATVQNRFADAERFVRQSLTLIKPTDRHQRAYALGQLSMIQCYRGLFAEAEEAARGAIDTYRKEGHWMAGINMGRLSRIFLHQGRYEQALMLIDQALSTAQGGGQGDWRHAVLDYLHPWRRGSVALAQGHYAEANQHLEQALAAWTPVAYSLYQRAALMGERVFALRGLDRADEARDQLASALTEALQSRSYTGLLSIMCGAALLALDQGNVARCLDLYAAAAAEPLVTNSIWYADIAGNEIAAAAGQRPVDIAAQARRRGANPDLWTLAQELVDALPS